MIKIQNDKLSDFNPQYDFNNDGFLDVLELRQMITDRQCTDLPKRLAKAILNRYDKNGDGKLDFEEFQQLSTDDPWFIRYYCVKLCQFLIPSRSRNHAGENSNIFCDKIDEEWVSLFD